MENLHDVKFFYMNLGFVYYSVYVLAILLSFRVISNVNLCGWWCNLFSLCSRVIFCWFGPIPRPPGERQGNKGLHGTAATPYLWHPTAIFYHFSPVTLVDLRDIIKHRKPSTSPNDAIPSQIIKDAIETIGPSILIIINTCLVSGTVPSCFKHAVA